MLCRCEKVTFVSGGIMKPTFAVLKLRPLNGSSSEMSTGKRPSLDKMDDQGRKKSDVR